MRTELKLWIAFSLLVLAVTVALRLPILQRSVIDWDESVYLLAGRSLVNGSLPYLEVWFHKQPFLYVVLAASFIVPDPVVGMRLLGCFGVAATAILLALLVWRLFGAGDGPAVR
jgi:4-amino-4-deoxy-L-arabinose transferase-like glycosyltransferase